MIAAAPLLALLPAADSVLWALVAAAAGAVAGCSTPGPLPTTNRQ